MQVKKLNSEMNEPQILNPLMPGGNKKVTYT